MSENIFGELFGSATNTNVSSTLSSMMAEEKANFKVEPEETVVEEKVVEEKVTPVKKNVKTEDVVAEKVEVEEVEDSVETKEDNSINKNILADLNAMDRSTDDDYDLADLQAGLEFADNMDPRAPVIVLADTSGSMGGDPLNELNKGLKTLFEELKNDELASRRVELSVIAYGSEVKELTDFTVVQDLVAPELPLLGLTETGKAIEYAVEKIEKRKRDYKNGGIEYYRPTILHITDGASTGPLEKSIELIKDGEENRKFSYFAVGVKGADMNELNRLAPRGGLKLKGYNFNELFKWLSASVQAVSASNPGDTVALPDLSGWAAI